MGWTSAVQEMLLGSETGKVIVLPALPSQWGRGAIRGLRCRGGISVSLRWDTARGAVELDLAADRDQRVDISFPTPVRSVSGAGATFAGNQIRGLRLETKRPLTLKVILRTGKGFSQ